MEPELPEVPEEVGAEVVEPDELAELVVGARAEADPVGPFDWGPKQYICAPVDAPILPGGGFWLLWARCWQNGLLDFGFALACTVWLPAPGCRNARPTREAAMARRSTSTLLRENNRFT